MNTRTRKKKAEDNTLTHDTRFHYRDLEQETVQILQGYALEVKGLLRQTYESAVRIGQILRDVKENHLPEGRWQQWVDYEFPQEIKHDTANNLINLATLVESHGDQYGSVIETIPLRGLYTLSRSSVEPETQVEVLEEIKNLGRKPTGPETQMLVQSFRRLRLAEAGIQPEVAELLLTSEIAEDRSQLESIARLSGKKQREVADLIHQGAAETKKEALALLKPQAPEEDSVVSLDYSGVEVKVLKGNLQNSLKKLPGESVQVAIVEAPMKFDFVDDPSGLRSLSQQLYTVLSPGGYCIITVGHKAALWAGPALGELSAIHLLCLRRQPGRTKAIVGANIMSASVFCILAYKPPYRAPKSMLVDLQTIDSLPEDESIEGLGEVPSGIENAFDRFLKPLVNQGDTVAHLVLGKENFGIRESLINSAKHNLASTFYAVG
jgi:hypothetical protein